MLRLETKAIHSGEPRPGIGRAVSLPIFQSSTFEYRGETRYDDILYSRLNNTPNHRALSAKMADLEGGEAAMVTASGMAAITTSLLTVLKPGMHLLAQGGLYGGTHDFVTHELGRLGIEHDWIEGDDPDSWERKVKQNTRAIYVESITNPLMEVPRLQEVVAFAREHSLMSLIDNTFATPVNFRPIEIGFDLVLHSATKYLNGHNDIVAGVLVGTRELVAEITSRLNHLGGTLDPHACFPCSTEESRHCRCGSDTRMSRPSRSRVFWTITRLWIGSIIRGWSRIRETPLLGLFLQAMAACSVLRSRGIWNESKASSVVFAFRSWPPAWAEPRPWSFDRQSPPTLVSPLRSAPRWGFPTHWCGSRWVWRRRLISSKIWTRRCALTRN